MNVRILLAAVVVSLGFAWPRLSAAPARVDSPAGIAVALDPAAGRYSVEAVRAGWVFAGELGAPATDVAVGRGLDRLGAYGEIRFRWNSGGRLAGAIRVYDQRPAVLFSVTSEDAAAAGLPALLPRFTRVPPGLHHFSYRDQVFSPPAFALEQNGTPWLLFDDRAEAAVISPAANFMTASMLGDGEHEIAVGLNPGVAALPAGFTHRALMVFEHGINAAWDAWGQAIIDLAGRIRSNNDADIGLRYLGYWTDNGAYYYYRYDAALGYAGTLEALVRHYRERGIPIRYLQLDSWWYSKTLTDPDGKLGKIKNRELPEGEWNRYGGLLKYEAHPAVLPDGLAGFQQKVGLPLITHNRWMDPASPYHRDYRISGYAAVDPKWWDHIMGYIAGGGVVAYEQDWLNIIYNHSPELRNQPGVGEAFTDNMARAARERGLSLQYCMPLPRYFLQGSRYANLTTVRVSGDRFLAARWDPFLYTSRLAASIGAWPWADVFMSTEEDNLLIATLSAGMVGTGDAIGSENRENLLRAARPDGVLVKPDAPLLPMDSVYVAEAAGGDKPPMIAATRTDHGPMRTAYVFAYNRGTDSINAEFTPASLGLAGEVVVLDVRSGAARRQPAAAAYSFELSLGLTVYCEVAPVGKSGIAFFGDAGKFVSNGRKRIAALEEDGRGLTATVVFAEGEKNVRLFGYAALPPRAEAGQGTAGPVSFDPVTKRFELEVSPAAAVTTEGPGADRIQRAVVTLVER